MLTIISSIPDDLFGGILFILENNYELYFEGIKYTLLISIVGTTLGLLLALFITVFRIQEINKRDTVLTKTTKKLSVWFSTTYVEFFRGTPMMVQAVIFFYGLSSLGFRIPIIIAGITIVTLNTAAYLTEVLRSGINAIDKGQIEGAKSLGLTRRQMFQYIIFPQVIKNMLPAIGNELVVNIKDTAVLSVIGVSELFYMGKSVAGTYYRYTESYILVAVIYLILVLLTTRTLTFLFKKFRGNSNYSLPQSQSNPVEVNA